MTAAPEPVTLYIDCQITRRKRFHLIWAEGERELFKSTRLNECIAWLASNGWTEYKVVSEAGTFDARLVRAVNQKGLHPWQKPSLHY